MRRTSYTQKLTTSAEKVAKNEREIEAKQAKEAENYEKHLKATYKKYEEEEKRHRQQEKESSYKLRKELQEFYSKEAERKRSAEAKQVSVGTCYQDAIDKINNIHRLNEERALRAQQELQSELSKNSHFDEILLQKRRSLSSINQEVPPSSRRKARSTTTTCPSLKRESIASSRNTVGTKMAHSAHSDTSRRKKRRPRSAWENSSKLEYKNGRKRRNASMRPRHKSLKNAPAFSYLCPHSGTHQQLLLQAIDLLLPQHSPRMVENSQPQQISHQERGLT